MNKVIVVKNEFVSKTNEEKELRIADMIARLINKSNYDKNRSVTAK